MSGCTTTSYASRLVLATLDKSFFQIYAKNVCIQKSAYVVSKHFNGFELTPQHALLHAGIGPATPHIILMGVTTAPIGGQISPTIAQILLTVNRGTSTVPCKRHRHRLRSPRGDAVSCLEKRCLSKCDVFLLRNFAHFFWGITFNALPKC